MNEQVFDKLSSANGSYLVIDDVPRESEPSPKEEIRELLKLVLPVMGTTVLEFLPGFVSVILAGNMDSPHAQHYVDASTISVMLLNVTAISIGNGLSSALDTLCSQAYGAKRLDKIGVYFQTGILVNLTVLVPMLVINFFAEPILNVLGQHKEVTSLTRDFSRLMLPGLPFLFLYEMVRKVLSAQNVLKPLVVIAVVANVVNVVAGYGLAYHTSMGFNGIAIARTLCNVTLTLLLVPYFWCNPEKLTQWWSGWDLEAAARYMTLFWRIGVPGMVMMAVEVWAFEILAILAGILPNSVVALSTHAVLMNVNVILWTLFYGFAVAASIRVGNCLGANEPKKARLACIASLVMTVALALVFVVVLYTLSDEIPRLFLGDGDSLDLASTIMAFWCPFEIVDGLNAVMQGIFRGAGKQKPAAIANVAGYYGAGISLGAVLAFATDLGVKGLWIGIGVGITLTVVALALYMLHNWNWDRLAIEARQRTEQ